MVPDYQEMYRVLFRSQTKAITLLQEAQRQTEELYISACEPKIVLLEPKEDDKPDYDGEEA